MSEKSGVAMIWNNRKWTLKETKTISPRIIRVNLEDEEGREVSYISAHFFNRTGQQREQWDKIEQDKEMTGDRPYIILADHNSILNTDRDTTQKATESENTKRQRTHEIDTMDRMGIADAWDLLYQDTPTEYRPDG